MTAEWRHLILITYSVDPSLLQPHLPKGVELDLRDGKAFVSFVAFDFLNTRLRGFRVPFHVNFPEINLRFYVRCGDRRGVVFIKELVPKFCIALIANKVYNEPYEAINMRSKKEPVPGAGFALEHSFQYGASKNLLRVYVEDAPFMPPEDSTEHFFKEHEWGFGTSHSGKTLHYRVEHPFWRVYPVQMTYLDVDFGAIYGSKWAFLKDEKFFNATVAEGSPVKVFPKNI